MIHASQDLSESSVGDDTVVVAAALEVLAIDVTAVTFVVFTVESRRGIVRVRS
jgi:hypothetical protein